MLQAMDQEKNMVTLAALSKADIQNLRNQTFFCPACHERVIVKAGERTIPHFAHRSSSICPTAHKGEGHFHDNGKMQLYQWLIRQFTDVGLETYLPEIKQRPDILLRIGKKQIAIEFQCARIPFQEIKKRNKYYKLAGIQPIWILGANLFRRKGKNHLSVSPFILTFLHQFHLSEPAALYFYCSETQTMIQASDLCLVSPQRAIACFSYFSLSTLHFAKIFHHSHFSDPGLLHHWQREKQTFRLRKRIRASGKEKKWQHWLYQHHLTVDTLPSAVYLPVKSAYLFMTAPWDWQSRICLDLLQNLPVNASFSATACKILLRDHLQPMTNFPQLIIPQQPITEYLSLLNQLKIIREYAPGRFCKMKELKYAKHIEAALKDDKELLKKLFVKGEMV